MHRCSRIRRLCAPRLPFAPPPRSHITTRRADPSGHTEPAWSQGINATAPSIGFDRIGRCGVERLSEREKERVAELWAAQAPAWVIHKEISRSRWAIRRYINRLQRPRKPEPKRSALRLSLVEREEISRGLAGGESLCSIARGLGRAPSTISREVRGERRCALLSRLPGGPRCAPPSSSAETSEAGAVRTAPRGGGGQARAALVAAADLRLARSSFP